ncbi:AfsR/SARP family transcriptional regulator [Pseudonocardia sp. TRM90224]|uniref:AfsR/SARP family transcriptional regulator n=1 Tax=Pseudonocardia sp. TRM90224 TaxID=2812678 RepID=UPI001E56F176|nr:AfsR/SARP family transcriptional regulator [Pseudonocardia sp. TRM90224]
MTPYVVPSMSVAVLGTLEACDVGGRPIPLEGLRVRRLVAVLVAHRGQIVRAETLTENVFAGRPPLHPAPALYSVAARLRRSVGDALARAAGGYALSAHTDAADFEAALAGAAETAHGLGKALELWRGPAYSEFLDLPMLAAEAGRLELRRLDTVERRAEALQACGRAADAVAELEVLLREHPFRERAHAALMRALYATGCHNDALRHYARYRRLLAAELGLEPTPVLRQLNCDILRHDVVSPALAAFRADQGIAIAG